MMRILQGTISYPEVKWGKAEERAGQNTALVRFVNDIAGVGADGMELWGRHLDNLTTGDIQALAKAIDRSGQKVEVLGPYWDFSSSDDTVESSLEDAKRYRGLCDLFGSRKVRVFVGAPASDKATEENWTRAKKGLARLAKTYKGSGVTFVVETHADQLADTPETCERLMRELAQAPIMINYQDMHSGRDEVGMLYKWVRHVHVSFIRDWGKTVEKTIRDLKAHGYDGTVTVEFCTDSVPPEGVKFERAKAIAGMKRDIAYIRSLVA